MAIAGVVLGILELVLLILLVSTGGHYYFHVG
jgi:hypothetical protein